MKNQIKKKNILIIGGGFNGLATAYFLSKNKNYDISIIEKENELGGLARSVKINENYFLEKFYHHWFTSDIDIINFIKEIGKGYKIRWKSIITNMYFANNFYKLSHPFDLLKLKLLPFTDRLKFIYLLINTKFLKNWKKIEHLSAKQWLISKSSKNVYNKIWYPLLKGKFGKDHNNVSAVWIWNKISLRGSNKRKKNKEVLGYYKNGFKELINDIVRVLKNKKVKFYLNSEIKSLNKKENFFFVRFKNNIYTYDDIIFTASPKIFHDLLSKSKHFENIKGIKKYKKKLLKNYYIGNICLILILNKSLSDSYWTNVNDPNFPFVGVIEHSNFDNPPELNGKKIVYISKYLSTKDHLYTMNDTTYFNFCIKHIHSMFSEFDKSWVTDYFIYREPFSQPVIQKNHSKIILDHKTPIKNLYINSMSNIYPEDRGTNYSIKYSKNFVTQIYEI